MMKKVSLENCPALPRDDGFVMKPFFGPETKRNEAIHMGYAVFKPGMRVPQDGYTQHEGDEFSYILSGSLQCASIDGIQQVTAGDAIGIPAGELHYSQNQSDTDCTLVYFIVKTI